MRKKNNTCILSQLKKKKKTGYTNIRSSGKGNLIRGLSKRLACIIYNNGKIGIKKKKNIYIYISL